MEIIKIKSKKVIKRIKENYELIGVAKVGFSEATRALDSSIKNFWGFIRAEFPKTENWHISIDRVKNEISFMYPVEKKKTEE